MIEVVEYRRATRRGERWEGRQSHRNSERMPGMGPGMKASGGHEGCMQSLNGEAGHVNHVAARTRRDKRTQKDLAKALGLTPVPLSRRLAEPESFTIGEFRLLARELGFSEAEIRKCI